jgi:hypothetical protein
VTAGGGRVSPNPEAAKGPRVFTAGASVGTFTDEADRGSGVEISADKSGTKACPDVAVGDSAVMSETACRDRAEKGTETFETSLILDS